ncbi:hypothetical protein [Actinacidiphila glaucinigra]|uniref:hypothetical protein n=1 Tax=Actinacidiphila glaucinigra TaxID=235986 RepID=UPI0035DF9EB9
MILDWDAKHGPVTGPINTGSAALIAGWAGHVAHMPPAWAAAIAGAGIIGTHIAGRRAGYTRATLGLRAAGWISAGGWCSWAIANGPFTQWGIGSLLAGAIGLGAAMAGAHHVEAKETERRVEAERAERRASLAGKRRAIADEWEDRILRVCNSTVLQVVNVEVWEHGGGFTIDGEFGPGGAKWRDLKAYEDALASDAKLPEGCNVEVKPGANRGAVLIDVATVNGLVGETPYPADYSTLHLDGPLPLGVYRDGAQAAPNIRELTTTLAGRKGSGKTNLANVGIGGALRMDDNVLWVIDLNGGGLALPWLRAWHAAGRPGRCPIDWVADTPEKVLAMAKAALAIAKARKPGYKHLEIEANTDKLPVSPTVPGILIGGDEIAELYSPKARRVDKLREAGDLLIQVVELARAVAVNALFTALRVTQDVIAEPQIIVQSGLKIGMKSDERELSYLFGWNDRVAPEDAPYAGCGFMKVLDDPARPFKAYRMLPQQIAEIVAATADRHPELDELSRRAAGEAYEQRWMGTDHLFGTAPAPAVATVEPEQPASPAPRGTGVTDGWGSQPTGGDAQALIDQADDARRRLHAAMGEADHRDDDLDAKFRQVVDGGGLGWTPPTVDEPDTGKRADPRKAMVFDIVARSGSTGIGPEGVREIFARIHHGHDAPHAATIGRWLDADPRIHRPSYGRYAVRPDHE